MKEQANIHMHISILKLTQQQQSTDEAGCVLSCNSTCIWRAGLKGQSQLIEIQTHLGTPPNTTVTTRRRLLDCSLLWAIKRGGQPREHHCIRRTIRARSAKSRTPPSHRVAHQTNVQQGEGTTSKAKAQADAPLQCMRRRRFAWARSNGRLLG